MTDSARRAVNEKTGDTAAMRILLVARGSEDARSQVWANLVMPLQALGHQVISFDPAQHLATGKEGTQEYAEEWFLTQHHVDVVAIVPTATGRDEPIKAAAAQLGLRTIVLAGDGLAPGGEPPVASVAINTTLFSPVQRAINHDVVVLADAEPARLPFIHALAESTDVVVYGNGWDTHPDLDVVTRGFPPAGSWPSVLSSGRVAVALERDAAAPPVAWVTGSSAVVALEAVSCAVPCVVPARVGSDDCFNGLPTFSTPEELVAVVQSAVQDAERLRAHAGSLRERVQQERSIERLLLDVFGPVQPQAGGPQIRVRKDGPKVSVFTAAYNIEQYIGDSLGSLLDQTMGDFEVLVRNDGSTDGTMSVVEKYLGDPRVRVLPQKNIAQTGRLDLIWRELLPEARGEYISGLDGDDVAFPNHLERAMAAFDEDPGIGLVHTGGLGIDGNSNVLGLVFGLQYSYDTTSQLRDLFYRCYIAHPTIAMRREIYDVVGPFEEGFPTDYQLWIKSAQHYRFRYLPEILVKYRIHEKGSSTTGAARDRAELEGARTRRVERKRYSIVDLYPALEGCSDPRAFAAAHLDLGSHFVQGIVDIELAIEEWERAIELLDGDCLEASWNIALLQLHAGDAHDGDRRLREIDRRKPSFRSKYTVGGDFMFAGAAELSSLPMQIPDAARDTAMFWDGTSVNTTRILVVPDVHRPDLLAGVVGRYAAMTEPNDRVDLCIATVGTAEEALFAQLAPRLSADVHLEEAGSITIERVDNPAFMPAQRFELTIDLRAPEITAQSAQSELETCLRRQRVNDQVRA